VNGIDRRAAIRTAMQARWDAAWALIRAIDRQRLLPGPLSEPDRASMNNARAQYDQTCRVLQSLDPSGVLSARRTAQ
jgi:hypothetical protein